MTQMEEKDPRTHAIIGAAMEVHTCLGSGFLEAIYQEALAIEFKLRGIPFAREAPVPVHYKGVQLTSVYRPDFLCFDDVVVELKALSRMGGYEDAQIIHYLKATNHPVGLLLNFGAKRLEYQRFAFTDFLSA